MGNRLILAFLFMGICCVPKQTFAEEKYPKDGGYSEKELREIRNLPDKDLKRMKQTWEKKDREAEQEMIKPAQEMRKAEGELNRAKRGEHTVKSIITGESLADQESRVNRAQYKYDTAKKGWEKERDEHSKAVYGAGVADIYLKEREDARKKSR